MKPIIWLITLFATTSLFAQSPNLKSSTLRLNAADFQTRAERDLPNGYPSLDGDSLVDPVVIFPGFGAAADGKFWVKSGSAMAIQPGITFGASAFTSGAVTIGEFATGLNGIRPSSGYPLILTGGTAVNKVYVGFGNILGGATVGHDGYNWQISPTGVFSLASGSLSGSVDFNGNDLTEVDYIDGSAMDLDLTNRTITGTGNVTFTLGGSGGVIVPSTGSAVNSTHALNANRADLLYGRLAAANTFTSTQTFSVAPVLPTGSVPQDRVISLVADLGDRVKRDGTLAMTGNLALGTNKITGLGDPTDDQDAVTVNYLNDTIASDTVASLTASAPLATTAAQGNITVSMPAAASLPSSAEAADGYLTAADHALFWGKEEVLSFTSPLGRSGNTISIPNASASAAGALIAADWTRFNGAVTGYTNGQIPIGSTATGLPVKSTITAGNNISVTNGAGSITIASTAGSPFKGALTTSGATRSNNTTALEVFSFPILANRLVAGSVIKITLIGRYTFSATNDTFTTTMRIGNSGSYTSIVATASPPATGAETSSNLPFIVELTTTVRSAGGSASWAGIGECRVFNSGNTPIMRSKASMGLSGSTFSTSIDQYIVAEMYNSTASSNSSFIVDQGFITID